MIIRNIRLCVMIVTMLLFAGCRSESFTVEMEPNGSKILKGYFDREHLENDSLFSWFKANYDAYVIDTNALKESVLYSRDVRFIVFLGTWCGDTKRELPKFFKICDALNIPEKKIILFGVDRTKKSVDETTSNYAITRVPTIIVFKGGQESGRIVERPAGTLETDLLRLIKN